MECRFEIPTAYEQAHVLVKQAFFEHQNLDLFPDDKKILFSYITFLSHLACYSLYLSTEMQHKTLAMGFVLLSLRYLKRTHEDFDLNLKAADDDFEIEEESVQIQQINRFIKHFKNELPLYCDEDLCKKARKAIIEEYKLSLESVKGRQCINLYKSFPEFLNEE